MKKFCFLSVLITLFCFSAFCDTEGNLDPAGSRGRVTTEQEEVDYLLFMPDSRDRFANEEQAMRQLDTLAEYLKGRELVPGQIQVYGYAASFANDVDATGISRDRALFVINELKRRGVSEDLFSEPVAYGEVDLWGSNTGEGDRSPNRRVRILLDGSFLTPAVIQVVEEETIVEEVIVEEEVVQEGKSCSIFPWILIPLLLLLAALLFFLLRKKKPVVAAVPIIVSVATSVTIVNLDEEILFCSYMEYLNRNGQSEDNYEDWLKAVAFICAKYEADGYQTYYENGSWWARKEMRN
jgi:hypothetical protein